MLGGIQLAPSPRCLMSRANLIPRRSALADLHTSAYCIDRIPATSLKKGEVNVEVGWPETLNDSQILTHPLGHASTPC